MYYLIAIGSMVVLPLVSIVTEHLVRPEADLIVLAGKWFVFWGIGVRLLLAGLMQVSRPSFTASGIFGIRDPDAAKIVVELGAANISIRSIGVLSLVWPGWVVPAGLAGALFLGFAGLKHAMNAGRNTKQNVAMATDLFVSAMIWISLAAALRASAGFMD